MFLPKYIFAIAASFFFYLKVVTRVIALVFIPPMISARNAIKKNNIELKS